ncbi:MAG: hypothetical protein ACLQVF_36005 [Isosphaeraceae bacterium]
MFQFTVYIGSASNYIKFESLDRKLMEAFEAWLADRGQPGYFIGTDQHQKRITFNFDRVGAIAEEPPAAGFQQ